MKKQKVKKEVQEVQEVQEENYQSEENKKFKKELCNENRISFKFVIYSLSIIQILLLICKFLGCNISVWITLLPLIIFFGSIFITIVGLIILFISYKSFDFYD